MKGAIQSVREVTDQLLFGDLLVGDWFDRVSKILKAFHITAFLDGAGVGSVRDLDKTQREYLAESVGQQMDYLEGFADDIQQKRYETSPAGLKARALLYPLGLKSSWWSGKTLGWPLPAMPGDGTTQCIVRCKCSWRPEGLNEKTKTGDWYWELGSTDESCQTCQVRARTWNPIRIENGSIV